MGGASDQFGDDEDEDEGWLTQSTFGLSSGPIPRTLTERRPLGHGFDVSWPCSHSLRSLNISPGYFRSGFVGGLERHSEPFQYRG
jgi:serine/threonine-protein phosphatase 6 regulatory subunit 3